MPSTTQVADRRPSDGPVVDPATGRDEGSVGQMVAAVSADVSALVKAEIELAKTELKVEVKAGALAAGAFVVAGLLGVVVFLFMSLTLAEALIALFAPRWLGYLIVALLYALIAGALALFGKSRLKKVGKPERTTRTAKDTVAWAKKPTQAPTVSRSDD